MAKKSKTAAIGDNSGASLGDEDAAVLHAYFAAKIRAQQKVVALKKAEFDAEKDKVNALFTQVRGELRINRKDFEEDLRLQEMSEDEFIAHEAARHNRLSIAGLPVGTQGELFPKGDAADDQARAYNDGKRAGVRADDPVPPSYISSVFAPDWQRGWSDGQAENMAKIGKAEDILAARAQKAGKLEADEANEPGEPTDDEQSFDDAA